MMTRTLLRRTTPEKSASEWPKPIISPNVSTRCHTCHPTPLNLRTTTSQKWPKPIISPNVRIRCHTYHPSSTQTSETPSLTQASESDATPATHRPSRFKDNHFTEMAKAHHQPKRQNSMTHLPPTAPLNRRTAASQKWAVLPRRARV